MARIEFVINNDILLLWQRHAVHVDGVALRLTGLLFRVVNIAVLVSFEYWHKYR